MTPVATPDKSTNVRVEESPARDFAARSLALALVLWAAGVALAAYDGVFARLGGGLDFALATFAAGFAAAAYLLDASVRALVDRLPASWIAAFALAGDAALALAIGGDAALAQGASALLAFFAAPLAAAAHLPVARALGLRFRKAPARSPGASPAAT